MIEFVKFGHDVFVKKLTISENWESQVHPVSRFHLPHFEILYAELEGEKKEMELRSGP